MIKVLIIASIIAVIVFIALSRAAARNDYFDELEFEEKNRKENG